MSSKVQETLRAEHQLIPGVWNDAVDTQGAEGRGAGSVECVECFADPGDNQPPVAAVRAFRVSTGMVEIK